MQRLSFNGGWDIVFSCSFDGHIKTEKSLIKTSHHEGQKERYMRLFIAMTGQRQPCKCAH